jgi:hypothetical protein
MDQQYLLSEGVRRTESTPCNRLAKMLSFFMIGTISWVSVTALFAQASAFQLAVPERAKIFSYIDTFMESGNIVPAFLFVFMSSEAQLRAYNTMLTYTICFFALGAMALLAFCWSIQLGGISIFILFGAWVAGAVGSTSMLVLFNFAGRYGRDAVSALSVGIGACGLVTNILGIVQGLPKLKDGGKNNTDTTTVYLTQSPSSSINSSLTLDGKLLFGPTTYFIIVGLWIAVSCIFLKVAHSCKEWQIDEEHDDMHDNDENNSNKGSLNGGGIQFDGSKNSIQIIVQKVMDAKNSISIACKNNKSSMAAIFVSCFLEFAAPGLIPYQIPKGPNHASNSFWITVFYLSGSLIGRLLTAVISFHHFTLLNIIQCGTIIYMLIVSKMEIVTIPVTISIIIIGFGSAVHGYIVTEVFQLCREAGESARASAVAGLANQVGALLGSVFVFILVKTSFISS